MISEAEYIASDFQTGANEAPEEKKHFSDMWLQSQIRWGISNPLNWWVRSDKIISDLA